MSTHAPSAPAGDAERAAHDAKSSKTLKNGIRAGLVAYGVVHILIGWLSIQLAFGDNEGSADNQGALQQLAETPLGKPLLWLVALGFLMLVIWQVMEASIGYEEEDDEKKRAGKRLASVGKAILYAVIAFSAVKVASGSGGGGGGSKEESMTAKLMGAPAGQLLVGLVGLAIIAVGVYLIRKGWKEKFRKQLEAGATGGHVGSAIVTLGKVGHIAKGVALGILGVLFVIAAIEHDAEKSGGLDDALKTILDQPYGPVMLTIMGLGLASFGVYCFARARYVKTSS